MKLENFLENLNWVPKIDVLKKSSLYAKILLKWNNTHNLSGVYDEESVYKNIFDSIYPLTFIQDFKRCVDVGSGAGFPAIALAMCLPQSEFILVEPRMKRVSFLQNLVIELELHNIRIEKCLIQELELQNAWADLITSRAVMEGVKLMQMTKKFLVKEGHYLFYKGSKLHSELQYKADECIHREERVYFYRKERQ